MKYYKKPVPMPVVVHKTEKIPVPVKRIKYVKVPVPEPSPPKIIYHTQKARSYLECEIFGCQIVSHAYDCDDGLSSWQAWPQEAPSLSFPGFEDSWSHSKRLYCCWRRSIGCPHSHTARYPGVYLGLEAEVYHTKTVYHTKVVPRKVHLPQKIIYKDITVHHSIDIDCNSGVLDAALRSALLLRLLQLVLWLVQLQEALLLHSRRLTSLAMSLTAYVPLSFKICFEGEFACI